VHGENPPFELLVNDAVMTLAATAPGVEATRAHVKDTAHHVYRKVSLLRSDEREPHASFRAKKAAA
jgi:hypothetical protein